MVKTRQTKKRQKDILTKVFMNFNNTTFNWNTTNKKQSFCYFRRNRVRLLDSVLSSSILRSRESRRNTTEHFVVCVGTEIGEGWGVGERIFVLLGSVSTLWKDSYSQSDLTSQSPTDPGGNRTCLPTTGSQKEERGSYPRKSYAKPTLLYVVFRRD